MPAWARSKGDASAEYTTLNTLPEDAYSDFAQFVADFAARYAGVIDQLIIWNEPNLAFEWGYQQVDPAGYARLLHAVYAPAHAANPNVQILAAGLAPTLEPEGSPNGLNDLIYLEQLYEAGAQADFDALAIHAYGFTSPPDDPPAADKLNFRRAELLRAMMVAHGDADKPAYITETGWNDNPRWTLAVTPSERIAYSVEALQWAQANWDWLDKMCFWVLRYPAAHAQLSRQLHLRDHDLSTQADLLRRASLRARLCRGSGFMAARTRSAHRNPRPDSGAGRDRAGAAAGADPARHPAAAVRCRAICSPTANCGSASMPATRPSPPPRLMAICGAWRSTSVGRSALSLTCRCASSTSASTACTMRSRPIRSTR